MPNRDDEELAVLLADLEETLTDLRAAVDEDVRRRRGRPPTPGELLRFTESYTIPTLIALLEATVRSLELLRAVLRLTGPRPVRETDTVRDRLGGRDAPDAETLRAALTDLREALTGTDLPEGSAAGSVLSDARELTDEIDDRLARAGERSDEQGKSSDQRTGVAIDVRAEGEDEADDGVDVESELESIKESLADENGDDDTED